MISVEQQFCFECGILAFRCDAFEEMLYQGEPLVRLIMLVKHALQPTRLIVQLASTLYEGGDFVLIADELIHHCSLGVRMRRGLTRVRHGVSD